MSWSFVATRTARRAVVGSEPARCLRGVAGFSALLLFFGGAVETDGSTAS
jgi:hypothetical protein